MPAIPITRLPEPSSVVPNGAAGLNVVKTVGYGFHRSPSLEENVIGMVAFPVPVSTVGSVKLTDTAELGWPEMLNRPAFVARLVGALGVPAVTLPKSSSFTPAAVSGATPDTWALAVIDAEALVCAAACVARMLAKSTPTTAMPTKRFVRDIYSSLLCRTLEPWFPVPVTGQ